MLYFVYITIMYFDKPIQRYARRRYFKKQNPEEENYNVVKLNKELGN